MRCAVILAGGGGTRLWPASRRQHPKQFLHLGGTETLLEATARRLSGQRTVVVTAADQVDAVRRALPNLGDDDVIAEPCGRNTAAALGLAAIRLTARDPDAVMAAIPADQHVGDEAELARVLDTAYGIAEANDVIVTIGLRPTRPETGFGYLELGADRGDGSRDVARFVEKPDAATAQTYVDGGNHLWNGGMFIVRAHRLLADIAAHMPDTYAGLVEIRDGDDDTLARVYPTLPSVSIDYGVMERASDVVCVPGDFGWHDVGLWLALADIRSADANGNTVVGNAVLRDANDNIVVSDDGGVVALVGVRDLVVVQAGDAVLVMPRDRAQDVRAVVDALADQNLDKFL